MFKFNFLKISLLFVLITIPFKSLYPNPTTGWKETVESVKPSILMIEIEFLAKIENDGPGCFDATGFIVDENLGIILTNRHVLGASPSTARATFWNKEKIPIKAIYYDPIHDFGFYNFDPSLLRWTKPKALKLGDSDKVKVGEEIRVLGNNAGKGFSILEGTVSWVKKNAPIYDLDSHMEFNTYYFQTSADISGGSSGGPIINKNGEVIAINSSSTTNTTISYGLPINIVKASLEAIKRDELIKRGDIGARIVFSTFDDIIEYGFPKELITQLKKKNKDLEGLLTVVETIPKTDASQSLKPGDVIWQVDDIDIEDSFTRYENILNNKVGQRISVKVVREGKAETFNIEVLDLEKLKIKSFVRIGSDYFSNIPIFLALSYNIPLSGVFAPYILYNFSEREDFPDFLVISDLNNKPIKGIEDFLASLKSYKDGDDVKIKYKVLKEDRREEEKVFKIDWKWFKPDHFKLNESNHEWVKEF